MKTIQEKNGEVEYVLTGEEYTRLHEANQAMLEALRICKPYIEEYEKLFLQTKSFFACNVINTAIAKGEQA